MKKNYIVPCAEIVLFETDKGIMDGEGLQTSGTDVFSEDVWGVTGARYGAGGSTIVNNNGTPTVIPGGNGGGRQTPLG